MRAKGIAAEKTLLSAFVVRANQLSPQSRLRLKRAAVMASLLFCVPLAFLRLPGIKAKLALYVFCGLVYWLASLCAFRMALRNRIMVRLQWIFLSLHLLLYGASYLVACLDGVNIMSAKDAVWLVNALAAGATSICLLSLTACGGGATRGMRLLDVAMAELLCWTFFLAVHSNDATGFSKHHLVISVATSTFLCISAIAAYKGSISDREAAFGLAAAAYLGLKAISVFFVNIVFYTWISIGESVINLLFCLPVLGFCLVALYLMEWQGSGPPMRRRSPNLTMRSLIPSVVAPAGILLALAIASEHLVVAGFSIAATMGCYVVRSHMLQQQMLAKQTSLVTQAAVMEQLAHRDVLTGVSNRRGLEQAIERCNETYVGIPVAMLLIDVDHFKQINDTYGHRAGDTVLVALAAVLEKDAKYVEGNCCARIGGDEFTLLLPRTGHEGAMHLAERIRRDVELLQFEGLSLGVSVSIGVAIRMSGRLTLLEMLHDADEGLYRVKSNGRNGAAVSGMHSAYAAMTN